MTHTQLSLFGDAPATETKEQIKRNPSVIQSGPIPDQTGYWYKLEINTLERSGHCKVCLQEVGTYKRQYHNCHTGQKVQSYYITPCQCRAEHFDKYQTLNEQGGHTAMTTQQKGLSDTQPLGTDTHARQCETNHGKVLQFETNRDIIRGYPTGYEGGTHDFNGRRVTHRQGGGSETEKTSRYHQANAERWQDPRLQDSGIVACEAGRTGKVDRGSEEHTEGLISVSSVATQLEAQQRLDPEQATNCRALPLRAYYTVKMLRIATIFNGLIGHVVADREVFTP